MQCIFCDSELSPETKPEHILLNALGGRKTSRRIVCSAHNELFGNTIDRALTDQLPAIRNFLQLASGSGRPPPRLRGVPAEPVRVDFDPNGMPRFAGKPFTITRKAGGIAEVRVMARSLEELPSIIADIAAALGIPEELVREKFRKGGLTVITQRPKGIKIPFSLGGDGALRSMAKSCLELWALASSNVEVRSSKYDDVRALVLSGTEAVRGVHMDTRAIPNAENLEQQFGPFYNLIYVRSDERGRVIGHFTLYNTLSWRFLLAEEGGVPERAAGLISNPLAPSVWSDQIADTFEIGFSWLDDVTEQGDSLDRAQGGVALMAAHHQKRVFERELDNIMDAALHRFNVTDRSGALEPDLMTAIYADVCARVEAFLDGRPYLEQLSEADLERSLGKAISPPEDS